ncbi:MAG: sugar phosphate isomerase/epimerase [Lachnospiraceae bacterium]|nr:sugar phosphate isomerase/epimerase [Lachnospiraceae bacterium]
MKLAYQMAAPDLERSFMVTAYQKDLESGFAMLEEWGYQGVEFMVRNPKNWDHREIERLCRKYHQEVVMLATGEIWAQEHISLSSVERQERERCIKCFREFIDLAGAYGAQVNIGRVRGEFVPGIPREYTMELALEAFRELAEYAEKKQVTLILEPVNFLQCNFINTTEEGRQVVDRVSHPHFQMMLDVFHMNIEDKDIYEEIRRSQGYVSYVHLCDRNRRYPGNSSLDFEKIIRELKAVSYDGWLSVEVLQDPDEETAVRKSAECLRPLL